MKELKLYNYVGSEEIKSSVANFQSGTVIRSISDLKSWINNIYNKEISSSNLIVATCFFQHSSGYYQGIYDPDWGIHINPEIPYAIWNE